MRRAWPDGGKDWTMKLHTTALSIGLAAALFASSAHGGPFLDFETQLRGVYGVYRSALFATNQKKADESVRIVGALANGWKQLDEKWAKTPPSVGISWMITLRGWGKKKSKLLTSWRSVPKLMATNAI